MSNHLFPSLVNLQFIRTILFILFAIPSSYCDEDELYAECKRLYTCGKSMEEQFITYPFWGNNRPQYCGRRRFELKCHGNQNTTIQFGDQTFRVLFISVLEKKMVIARDELFRSDIYSPGIFKEPNINNNLFSYRSNVQKLSIFYNCSGEFSAQGKNNFSCPTENGHQIRGFYTIDEDSSLLKNRSNSCNRVIKVPILGSDTLVNKEDLREGRLTEVLTRGFELEYHIDNEFCSECMLSHGECGSNQSSDQFSCLCFDKPYPRACPGGKPNVTLKLIIGFGAALGGMGIMAVIFLIYLRRYKKKNSSLSVFSCKPSSDPSSTEDLEKGDNFLGVHVFTYAELEEATNNFDSAKELGDGGFGTVYYGELQDGRAVAVKRLYENNYRRVEQFMNEVEILALLRHQNLVSLYGCTSRHSRELLLVYEYIPNGTIADHLHGGRAKPGEPSWPTRLKIAIETAKALTYLHASDVIHRDVKTNNILLDNNFCVKVADFGLSRLFPNHVTHVSTAPQGTPGYVDPEYHQCYRLTEKSDVFSFGVVLIELISSMPAVDISRHRHEINLSNLAINKIQSKALHELVDSTLGYESDYSIRKMINAVAELAFQCLQSEKDMRPNMADVLETLKDIQNGGYNKVKEEEMDIPLEDVKLLKSGTSDYSPDSEFCHSKLDHQKGKTNATN